MRSIINFIVNYEFKICLNTRNKRFTYIKCGNDFCSYSLHLCACIPIFFSDLYITFQHLFIKFA